MYDRDQQSRYEEERPKKGGILKKAALITAGAVLFGTVAGAVMVGIHVAASGMIGNMYASVMA